MTGISLAYDAAKRAGFTGAALITAVAIAGAESAFNPNAIGDVNLQDDKWGPSVGLWQIRSLKNYQLYSGADKLRNAARLTDPYYNAVAAFAISNGGTNFNAWSTYTNNSYTKFISDANSIINTAVDTVANNPVKTTALVALILLLIFWK